jgi:hypothetical protein
MTWKLDLVYEGLVFAPATAQRLLATGRSVGGVIREYTPGQLAEIAVDLDDEDLRRFAAGGKPLYFLRVVDLEVCVALA